MATKEEIKIPSDIEFRVIGNVLGLLISSAGILAGSMVRMNDIDYWPDDIVPLLIAAWMAFRLFRNFISTMIAYPDVPVRRQSVKHNT